MFSGALNGPRTVVGADPGAWAENSDLLRVALESLPPYLMQQRWYPAKDAGAPAVALTQLIPIDVSGISAAMALWRVTPPGRADIDFFLPLAIYGSEELDESQSPILCTLSDGRRLGDALASDAFVQWLIHLILGPSGDSGGELYGVRSSTARTDMPPAAGWTIKRSHVEQSNTSIRMGDEAILKIIRRPVQGVHPELEMGRFLAERSDFGAIAAPLGWIEYKGMTLAILQAFVANEGDGWTWVLERLHRGAAESAKALTWIRKLGERTAEMHRALATETSDAAFSPEPAGAEDWQKWTDGIVAMVRRIETALDQAQIPGDEQGGCIERFKRQAGRIAEFLKSLTPAPNVLCKTRHHGDFHLGQVLVHGDDATIVDFEGEPMRSLEERRSKQVPLRDVAGMLRSISYVAAVAARERPRRDAGQERATEFERLKRWAEDASTVYLDGYSAKSDVALQTGRTQNQARVVQFFTIEKALYEVLYELANRPDWVQIPLGSLVSLLDQVSTAAGSNVPDPALLERRHSMPQGAEILPDGGVRFRLWAPQCQEVRLALKRSGGDAKIEFMESLDEGWHQRVVSDAAPGTRYQFVLADDSAVPDPASRFQPDDVHGFSEVIDPASYRWRDRAWASRPWHEAIIYELHVGTFTPQGTFLAAIERLEHLAILGVTAIELMPIADFPGSRNWGYDGVLLYAPDSSYGRPDDLKALIDAAHARGIMVLLDVVYNHFGPDGNYLPVYAPKFFTDRHKTPWGAAINYDGQHAKPVREFVIHNALYWIEEYNLDGLRLDAVHAILDDGEAHLLKELAERVRASRQWPVHLLLENEENEAHWLMRDPDGEAPLYSAQWNDDVHHVLHVAATGEDKGYYADYLRDTGKLARSLAEGFAFQGEMMAFRGEARGEPSAQLPPWAFVAFIQNHDQIGNRAFGERISCIAPQPAVRAIASIYLLLPQIPMLFMGEEWGAGQPFPFFCDFSGELAEAVRQGRRQEFAKFPEFQDATMRERIPDPQAASTFAAAKLNWADLGEPSHAAWLGFYRQLLTLRREVVQPLLLQMQQRGGCYEVLANGAVIVTWSTKSGGHLRLEANLSSVPVRGFRAAVDRVLWTEGSPDTDEFGPWAVRWSAHLEQPA